MAIEIKDGKIYVDSFAEALEAAELFPNYEYVIFNNPEDYFLAERISRALGVED